MSDHPSIGGLHLHVFLPAHDEVLGAGPRRWRGDELRAVEGQGCGLFFLSILLHLPSGSLT